MEDFGGRSYGTSGLDNRPLFGETSAWVRAGYLWMGGWVGQKSGQVKCFIVTCTSKHRAILNSEILVTFFIYALKIYIYIFLY